VVDPTNGQLWAEVTDLAVPGLPEPLAFSRMWDGERWSWTADATLDIQGDGVRLERPGQPDELFPPLSTNPQEPWCAVGLELAGSGGGTLVCIEDGYEVHSADGTLEHFDGLGRLLRRTAPQGEELLLSPTEDASSWGKPRWSESGSSAWPGTHPDSRPPSAGATRVDSIR
jgi:hypothetical protein